MTTTLPRDNLVSIDGEPPITWGDFLALNDELSAEEIDDIEADLLAAGTCYVGAGAGALQTIWLVQ